MATISNSFEVDGIAKNGAAARLYSSGAPFATNPPIKGTAFPASGQVGSEVTTGTTHGGDGQYRFTGVGAGNYFVGVSFNGTIVWDSYSVQSDVVTTVKTYGAIGDGITNDTAAVQAALNDTAVGEVLFPPGVYLCGNLTINSRQRLKLRGSGGYIQWTGTATGSNQIGLQLTGTNIDIQIQGLYFLGNSIAADGHAGVWSITNPSIQDVRIVGCRFENLARGVKIGLTVATGGALKSLTVENCEFLSTRGTPAGQGEAFFLDDDSAGLAGVRIIGNRFDNSHKYDVHVARGNDIQIIGNTFTSHRSTTSNGTQVPSVRLTKCQHVQVIGNEFVEPRDGSIEVVSQAGVTTRNVQVIGNTFNQTVNAVHDIIIGTANPAVDGFPDTVSVTGNSHETTSVNVGGLKVFSGKFITIGQNNIRRRNINTAGPHGLIVLVGSGESGGTSNYNDDIHCDGNVLTGTISGGGVLAGFDLQTALCTAGSKLSFTDNRVSGGNEFISGAAITNPNIHISGAELDGLTVATATAFGAVFSTQLIPFAPVTVITSGASPYTLLGADYILIADSSGGAITVAPPTAVGRKGRTYFVTRQGANTVTVDPAGAETIGGAATYALGLDGAAVQFVSDGVNWRLFGTGV